MTKNKAQGTIEYLVIIAIVIVIGLVVVSLAMNVYDTEQLTKNKDKLSQITSSINVVDTLNYSGETIINLKNTAEGNITLTRISVDNETQEYDKTIIQGNNELITLDNLCKCEKNQTKKTCEIEIHYTTQHNLPKKITQKITVNCEENVKPNKPPTPPIITNCFNIEDNPIQICTLQDLNNIRTKLNGNYILMKNIDATDTKNWNGGNGWEPIGNVWIKFSGTLNGNNYSIKNLYINYPNQRFVSFIGNSNNAVIKNISFIDLNVIGNDEYVGGLIGSATSANITNVFVSGEITGKSPTGGLVGSTLNSNIDNVRVEGVVNGEGAVGGVIGLNQNTPISFASFDGNINAIPDYTWITAVGGIVGQTDSNITNSFVRGNIVGESNIGGITGYFTNPSASTVTFISNSFFDGNITGSSSVGGIIGVSQIGGINNKSGLKNTYSIGRVTGLADDPYHPGNIGGLVGNSGTFKINISNSFSTAIVSMNSDVFNTIGGLSGSNSVQVSNSFWDETTTQTKCYPSGSNGCTLTNDESYYFNIENEPLASWSEFPDTWVERENDYPILK